MMTEEIIVQLCMKCFMKDPKSIKRCGVGQGNYVYIVELVNSKYVIRCSQEDHAYSETIYWLEKLASIDIPVPIIISHGRIETYEYMILSYVEGKDIGLVYTQLTDEDKRVIAKEIVQIQNKVGKIEPKDLETDWTWFSVIVDMLERSKERIIQNGYFDAEKVARIKEEIWQLELYFENIQPIAYLDDISTKNLLIHNGRISGIIDVDWIGIGDKLTYVALTNMALLNSEYDTDYIQYILQEMQVDATERKAFLFYTLLFCVDFMGERGMQFMDKHVEVNQQIIDRLNNIYNMLWEEWKNSNRP